MVQKRSWLWAFGLILLGSACSAARAEGWPVQRGPSHEPDPYRYDAHKPPVVPKELLEDAAACVLYAGNTYLVEPDGTINFPYVGRIRAAGRTEDDLARTIERRLIELKIIAGSSVRAPQGLGEN